MRRSGRCLLALTRPSNGRDPHAICLALWNIIGCWSRGMRCWPRAIGCLGNLYFVRPKQTRSTIMAQQDLAVAQAHRTMTP